MQADGLDQLRTPFGGNRGDTGDSFPGSTGNHDFGLATLPATVDWNGLSLDTRFDHITVAADGSATFRYLRRIPSVIASQSAIARIRIAGVPTSVYREILAPGDVVAVSADSSQVSFDGRTSAQFLAWSDGGARSHSLVARAGAPDTLTASFAIANRVRVAISGPGAVVSSVPRRSVLAPLSAGR